MADDALSALFDCAQEKICTKCGILKPFSEFHKSKKHSTGVASRCRDCDNARHNKGVIGAKSTCIECGAVFSVCRGGQKYCSERCKTSAAVRREHSKRLEAAKASGLFYIGKKVPCVTCGEPFAAKTYHHKVCAPCKWDAKKGVGIVECCDCGVTCPRTGPAQKRCPACSVVKANGPRPERKKVKFCADCGVGISSRKKRCDECRKKKDREDDARRQRERRADPITGEIIRQRARENPKPYNPEYMIAYERRRKSEDPKYALNIRMKTLVKDSLRGNKRGRAWKELVGYTADDLYSHLERQFLPGMTWENRDEWHIDHIVPVAAFDFEDADDPDFKACWALTNLRPLWAKANISKSDKRIYLI